MRGRGLLLFVAALAANVFGSALEDALMMPRMEDVLTVNRLNVNSAIADTPVLLLGFYAPWCGHCKAMFPEYSKAATILKAEGVVLGLVDATMETDLATKFYVRNYPTFKVFRNGRQFDFDPPRPITADGLVKLMRKWQAPSLHALSSVETAQTFFNTRSQADPTFVYFHSGEKKGVQWEAVDGLASSLRDKFSFAESSDPEVLKKYGISKDTFAVFTAPRFTIKAFDDEQKELSGPFTEDELHDFIYANAYPLVSEITKANESVMKYNRPAMLYTFMNIDWTKDPKGINYIANRVRKGVKQAMAGRPPAAIKFTIADKDDFKELVDAFNAKEAVNGGGVAVGIEHGFARYKMEEPFSVEAVQKFVEDYLDYKLEPWVRSENPPAVEAAPGEVVTVVGKTFNKLVYNPNKDVLLEIYAPWCGHCKNLEPAYKELAKRLEGNEYVVIAKMDGTANDAPHREYAASGYPTIYYARAGSKDTPEVYNGGRTVDEMYAFLKENASRSWKTGKKVKKAAAKYAHDEA